LDRFNWRKAVALVYIVLAFELMMILPMASVLKQKPNLVPLTWQLVGVGCFMMTVFSPLGLSVISWPFYAGHTKGAEITIIDIVMVAIYVSQKTDMVLPKLPFRIPMKMYFCAVTLSAVFAQLPEATLFYSWQLLRMYFVFVVVARACGDERVVPAVMKGLAIGLLIELAYVLYQKFVIGDVQPNGTFIHQNQLGFVANLVMIPILAVFLNRHVGRLLAILPLGAFTIVALIASRATLGLSLMGTVLTYIQSIVSRTTPRKSKIGIAIVLFATVLVPIALSSLEKRAVAYGNTESDYDERAAFINAASAMLTDHPYGVGANNFVIVANTAGYYDRAGVAAVTGSRSAHVHNLYWLTLAETGYFGFLAISLLIIQSLYVCFFTFWKFRGHPDAELMGGFGVALLLSFMHSYYEWLIVTGVPQYFVAITLGIVAATSVKPKIVKAGEVYHGIT
jgi:O-antigen ligase